MPIGVSRGAGSLGMTSGRPQLFPPHPPLPLSSCSFILPFIRPWDVGTTPGGGVEFLSSLPGAGLVPILLYNLDTYTCNIYMAHVHIGTWQWCASALGAGHLKKGPRLQCWCPLFKCI